MALQPCPHVAEWQSVSGCFPDDRHEAVDVGVPRLIMQRRGVAAGERLNRFGQFVGRGHARALDQYRDHEHVGSAQRGSDFVKNVVVGLFEAAPARLVLRVEPLAADQDETRAGITEPYRYRVDEVLARLKCIDVAEYRSVAQAALQCFGEASRVACRILPTIADENLRHARGSMRR